MKHFKLTITFSLSDEGADNDEWKEFKRQILTGKMQREMIDNSKEVGMSSVKIVLEEKGGD
jgi:hypothetical protein